MPKVTVTGKSPRRANGKREVNFQGSDEEIRLTNVWNNDIVELDKRIEFLLEHSTNLSARVIVGLVVNYLKVVNKILGETNLLIKNASHFDDNSIKEYQRQTTDACLDDCQKFYDGAFKKNSVVADELKNIMKTAGFDLDNLAKGESDADSNISVVGSPRSLDGSFGFPAQVVPILTELSLDDSAHESCAEFCQNLVDDEVLVPASPDSPPVESWLAAGFWSEDDSTQHDSLDNVQELEDDFVSPFEEVFARNGK